MNLTLAGLLVATVACAQPTGKFERLAEYTGLGGLVASAVGPGRQAGSERLYLSYLYIENTIDVVAVDPETGAYEVFSNPAPTESGARTMAVGPDGNVYLGTLPHAHLLKLDVKAGKLIDLGRPSRTEQYIWDVNFGPDGKLYGATYPGAKLVRYDPATGKSEDLGQMDATEQYAHYVAGAGEFVYVGIGTSKQNIIAFHIPSGEHRSILAPEFQTVGQANVYRGRDGKVYGHATAGYFRLEGWKATQVDAPSAEPEVRTQMRDGRVVSVRDGKVLVKGLGGAAVKHPYGYDGKTLPLFRVGFGPDGELYGSSVLPIHFVKLDPKRGAFIELGMLGGGEIYSFLARGKEMLAAAYAGLASLMRFDTTQPFVKKKNPALVRYVGSDSGWRPQAMISGPGGRVYMGSVAGYGKLGGPLTVWDVESGAVEQFPHLVTNQSVITLAVWRDRIVGGTTVGGGGGSHPTEKEAKLFIWNPATKQKEFEMTPLEGVATLDDFITAPDGMVYGFGGGKAFAFDAEARSVKARRALPFSGTVYNSVAIGPDGRIWGLTRDGIFAIDMKTLEGTLVAKAPEPITAGFALRDGAIYFACGPVAWRYVIGK